MIAVTLFVITNMNLGHILTLLTALSFAVCSVAFAILKLPDVLAQVSWKRLFLSILIPTLVSHTIVIVCISFAIKVDEQDGIIVDATSAKVSNLKKFTCFD